MKVRLKKSKIPILWVLIIINLVISETLTLETFNFNLVPYYCGFHLLLPIFGILSLHNNVVVVDGITTSSISIVGTRRSIASEAEDVKPEESSKEISSWGGGRGPRLLKELTMLNRQSCLSKILCGVDVATSPSSSSSTLNDYAYIVKSFFDTFALSDSSSSSKKKKKKPSQDLDEEEEGSDEENDQEHIDHDHDDHGEDQFYSYRSPTRQNSKYSPSSSFGDETLDEMFEKPLEELLGESDSLLFDFRRRQGKNALLNHSDNNTTTLSLTPIKGDDDDGNRRGYMGYRNPRFDKTAFLNKKQLQIEQAVNNQEKLNIASEIAAKFRSPRQCRLLSWLRPSYTTTTTITTTSNNPSMMQHAGAVNTMCPFTVAELQKMILDSQGEGNPNVESPSSSSSSSSKGQGLSPEEISVILQQWNNTTLKTKTTPAPFTTTTSKPIVRYTPKPKTTQRPKPYKIYTAPKKHQIEKITLGTYQNEFDPATPKPLYSIPLEDERPFVNKYRPQLEQGYKVPPPARPQYSNQRPNNQHVIDDEHELRPNPYISGISPHKTRPRPSMNEDSDEGPMRPPTHKNTIKYFKSKPTTPEPITESPYSNYFYLNSDGPTPKPKVPPKPNLPPTSYKYKVKIRPKTPSNDKYKSSIDSPENEENSDENENESAQSPEDENQEENSDEEQGNNPEQNEKQNEGIHDGNGNSDLQRQPPQPQPQGQNPHQYRGQNTIRLPSVSNIFKNMRVNVQLPAPRVPDPNNEDSEESAEEQIQGTRKRQTDDNNSNEKSSIRLSLDFDEKVKDQMKHRLPPLPPPRDQNKDNDDESEEDDRNDTPQQQQGDESEESDEKPEKDDDKSKPVSSKPKPNQNEKDAAGLLTWDSIQNNPNPNPPQEDDSEEKKKADNEKDNKPSDNESEEHDGETKQKPQSQPDPDPNNEDSEEEIQRPNNNNGPHHQPGGHDNANGDEDSEEESNPKDKESSNTKNKPASNENESEEEVETKNQNSNLKPSQDDAQDDDDDSEEDRPGPKREENSALPNIGSNPPKYSNNNEDESEEGQENESQEDAEAERSHKNHRPQQNLTPNTVPGQPSQDFQQSQPKPSRPMLPFHIPILSGSKSKKTPTASVQTTNSKQQQPPVQNHGANDPQNPVQSGTNATAAGGGFLSNILSNHGMRTLSSLSNIFYGKIPQPPKGDPPPPPKRLPPPKRRKKGPRPPPRRRRPRPHRDQDDDDSDEEEDDEDSKKKKKAVKPTPLPPFQLPPRIVAVPIYLEGKENWEGQEKPHEEEFFEPKPKPTSATSKVPEKYDYDDESGESSSKESSNTSDGVDFGPGQKIQTEYSDILNGFVSPGNKHLNSDRYVSGLPTTWENIYEDLKKQNEREELKEKLLASLKKSKKKKQQASASDSEESEEDDEPPPPPRRYNDNSSPTRLNVHARPPYPVRRKHNKHQLEPID